MNIEEFREFCLSKPGVEESFPFDSSTLVFKVMDKMFALTGLDREFSMNLKCEPEKAIELRAKYPTVQPGYHMSKKHWNTVYIDGSIDDETIYGWVNDSYNLVVATLPKTKRVLLEE